MLRVWAPSGEELLAVPEDQLSDVKALKRQLCAQCQLPRFRQRLLHESEVLADDAKLTVPLDLQLVRLPFVSVTRAQVELLISGARAGNLNLVEKCLQLPQDPSLGDDHMSTALHQASSHGHVEIVQLLLEARATANASDPHGNTALHLAAGNGYVKVVRSLVDAGLEKDAANKWGSVPLHYASCEGHLAAVRALIEAGVYKDAADNEGRTALHNACENGQIATVRLLLDAGVRRDIPDREGQTAATLFGEFCFSHMATVFP